MKRLLTTLLITLLLAPLAAPAMVAPPADDGVFVEGARYDAVLDAQACPRPGRSVASASPTGASAARGRRPASGS